MPENESKDFYIVGIGASAGGLDAIQKLFDHIPSNTGIAFVIIQHLSPDFKSLMPELLAKHTSMSIFTADDQLEVYPNSIYLMHRNKNLVIKGNKLHLLEKAPKHSLNLPIDIFFQSLGEEYKEKSIGIILSGTGTDGSRGIKTIKESGGVILVQDPLSAQFNGMPNAAIASGLAEFVAEPEAMAAVLQQIPNLDLATELSNNQSNDEIFSNILDEIKIYAGIDFKQYKKNTLVRRIEKRMSLNNMDVLLNYYQLLKASVSDMFGVQFQDLIGKTSLSLIIPEDHGACINAVEKCLAEPNKTFWTTLRKPSPGGVIVSQWEFKVLKDDQGNPNEILCLGHEITPLIKKQEELQSLLNINLHQKNRLIQFTHILSHNFRSHVANLKGIMSLANSATNEEKLEFFNMVSSVANSLDETLIHLNDIIAIQTTEDIQIKSISLSSAIHLAEKSLGLTIAETNATIHHDFKENDLIQSNPAYLDSILLNILTNSLKYRKPDTPPEIHITLERIKGFSKLIIRDNGRGLDLKKYGSKVFGLYKTFHGNKDAKGLGLFITKTQVESMHGNVDIESEPNMGTSIIVELPYSESCI